MTVTVLTIGTELTRGELVDTNATWLAASATALGFEIDEIDTIDDDRAHIVEALKRLSSRAKIVLVTGGLGPTTDDLTAECAALAAGVPLVQDPASLESIRRRLASLGRTMSDSNARQASVPQGAEVLGNPVGTAPAFRVRIGSADCFFMPGVPREMKAIFEALIVPRIGPMAEAKSFQIVLRTYGLPESVAGDRLAGLEEKHPGLIIGYRASFPEVEVKVRVRDRDLRTARERAGAIASEVRARLGDEVYGEGDDTLASAVGRALRARGWTLSLAESCTGGLIGALLTEVPGSSEYFLLDAVTYSNAAKERVLGVPNEVLMAHGAVSAECVTRMARGVRHVAGADVAVAVSGIAGPGGGSSEKPVGTVFFALVTPSGETVLEKHFTGDRARVQRAAAFFVLGMIREACRGPVPASPLSVCG